MMETDKTNSEKIIIIISRGLTCIYCTSVVVIDCFHLKISTFILNKHIFKIITDMKEKKQYDS